MLYYPNIPVTNLFTWLTWQLMELLQLHDGEGEELVAIGDRFGYRVAHPEGFAGTYDFLAGTVTSTFIQSKQNWSLFLLTLWPK